MGKVGFLARVCPSLALALGASSGKRAKGPGGGHCSQGRAADEREAGSREPLEAGN